MKAFDDALVAAVLIGQIGAGVEQYEKIKPLLREKVAQMLKIKQHFDTAEHLFVLKYRRDRPNENSRATDLDACGYAVFSLG